MAIPLNFPRVSILKLETLTARIRLMRGSKKWPIANCVTFAFCKISGSEDVFGHTAAKKLLESDFLQTLWD
jgi:hypothetical protein